LWLCGMPGAAMRQNGQRHFGAGVGARGFRRQVFVGSFRRGAGFACRAPAASSAAGVGLIAV
jgi:hypothetical protein